ncbi:hypothetical protein R1L06_19090 [Stenotrophomonas sp. C4297]|uniref:hypothetical protein n=1 Tax=Stenotrophomonas sp. C4297 TaxID=3077847 RepID=UPI00293D017E|nr:hypothetical protein [Stenotrophomonas sp. C4297]MDV3512836.1 hypothetical protein [Stenotrophomonas sp. C4297]
MSISVKRLITEDVWKWLCGHSSISSDDLGKLDHSAFWIRAGEPGDETVAEESSEVDLFRKIRNVKKSSFGKFDFLRFSTKDGEFILTLDSDGALEIFNNHDDYETQPAPLLMSLLFATKTGATATSIVPARLLIEWASSEALADDLRTYLPKVILVSLSGERAKYGLSLLSTLMDCEYSTRDSSGEQWLRGELCDLALRLPDNEHEWLYADLSNAARSTHVEHKYLLIYRIFEFFFPMEGINSLRDSAQVVDTHLNLLQKCRTDLNWFWRHDTSAQAVARFAKTGRFAEPLKAAGIISEDATVEQAASKLVSIRNQLAHQAYKFDVVDESCVRAAIASCIMLCSDAFETYNEWRFN